MTSISFEGNIGAGKSTFIKLIQEEFDVEILEEPVELWRNVDGHNLLDNFYANPKKYAYLFQSFAFISRIKNQIPEQEKPIRIMERSALSDKCFALNCHEMGLMNDLELAVYEEWWNFFLGKFDGHPNKIIYLRTEPDICLERIRNRNRFEEKDIDIDYLQKLHRRHENWFPDDSGIEEILNIPYITLDANQNFLNDPEVLYQMMEDIGRFIEF